MASDIFRNIVEQKINIFANTFGQDANKLFKKDNKLIHPLEYGMYRERCAKELLEVICDRTLAVSDGFMISSENNVSKQCDIIIYKRDTMPIVDNGITNFFPVEIVKCIGEIKSTLNKSEFKEALVKLANNKKMFVERKGAQQKEINLDEKDEIISFLICNNLNFKIEDIDFDDIYEEISDIRFRHNMILSLQDGLLLYLFDINDAPEKTKSEFCKVFEVKNPIVWFFSHSSGIYKDYKCRPHFMKADEGNVYEHVIYFLNGLNNAMYGQREYKLDIGIYLTDKGVKFRKNEL